MGLKAYQQAVATKKRQTLLEAAERLFLAQGYERASVAAIADEAGVSLATLYKHYRTKGDLFAAVIEDLARDLADRLGADLGETVPPEIALREYLLGYAQALAHTHFVELIRLLVAEASAFPELAEAFYDRAKKPLFAPLVVYLEAQRSRGFLTIEKPELALRQLLGMVEASLIWRRFLLRDPGITETHVREVAEEATATFLARYRAAG